MNPRNKRLILCCDGTWNNPEQKHVTNVVKISRAIRPVARDGRQQIVFYDWGVGSEGVTTRLSGGTLGKGLDKNVQDAFRFLVHNYSKGDEIFLFGFSRGGYTARSIAGLIRNAGILKKANAHLIKKAYELYRSKEKPDAASAKAFRKRYSREANIKFVGVWDTVGSLGIPLRIARHLNKKKYSFHDTSLSKIIQNACHALAIDEKRRDFKPTLWKRPPKGSQTIEQTWFAGVHCDIGGGYKEEGLSDTSLKWMCDRAKSRGLSFDAGFLRRSVRPNPNDKLHKSYTGIYWAKGKHIRPIGELPRGLEKIHPSVLMRFRRKRNYRPKNLLSLLKR